jgi:hypothetical protein
MPIWSTPLDQIFDFPNRSMKGIVEFEKKRTVCIYNFNSKDNSNELSYLQTGIPNIIIGNLRNMDYVYDENVQPTIIRHVIKSKEDFQKEDDPPKGYFFTKEPIDLNDIINNNPKGKKDPRKINLEFIYIKNELSTKKNEINCSYQIRGIYSKQGDAISISIEFQNLINGNQFSKQIKIQALRFYQDTGELFAYLRQFFELPKSARLTVEIDSNDNFLVLLDGVPLGKSPFSEPIPVSPGTHEITIQKEGYNTDKKIIQISDNTTFTYKHTPTKPDKKSFISVTTNPEGADAYWGSQFLGKTPVKNVPVSSGKNRLRISMEGYIDYFTGLDLKEGELSESNVSLNQGDSEIYYNNKQNVFLDYTYQDFTRYSLYSSLFFFGTYFYYGVQADHIKEGLRPQIKLVNGAAIISAQSSNTPETFYAWYIYEQMKIDQTMAKYNQYKDIGGELWITRGDRFHMGYSFGGVLLSLIGAYTFLNLSIDKESIDIGFRPLLDFNPYRSALTWTDNQAFILWKQKF